MIIGISGKIDSGKDTVGKIIQFLTSPEHLIDEWNNFENWIEAVNDNPINTKWQIKKFADKLKDIVCILIGCTREQLEDHEFKNKPLGKEWDKWHLQELWINSEDAELITDLYFNTEAELDEYVIEFNHTFNTHTKVGLVSLTPRTLLQRIGTESMRNIIHPNIWVNTLMQEYKVKYVDYQKKDVLKGSYPSEIYPSWCITDVRFPNEAQAIKDRGGIIIRVERPSNNDNTSKHQSETALDDWKFDHAINNNGSINELVESVKSLNLQL